MEMSVVWLSEMGDKKKTLFAFGLLWTLHGQPSKVTNVWKLQNIKKWHPLHIKCVLLNMSGWFHQMVYK